MVDETSSKWLGKSCSALWLIMGTSRKSFWTDVPLPPAVEPRRMVLAAGDKTFITTATNFQVLEYEIKYRPSFSILQVRLAAGEQITTEAGAMVYMSDGVLVKPRTRSGGLFQKVKAPYSAANLSS